MGFAARAIGMKNAPVSVGVLRLEPGKECGAEIEACSLEIIDDLDDLAFSVKRAGAGVGVIALVMNTLVPVVEGRGAILLFDLFDPRIFARGLIKMPVKTDTNFVGHNQ
jgi:hypothetical protein